MSQNFDYMKATKTNIKRVLRDPDKNLPIIEDLVIRTNKIVTHTYQFLKLWMLYMFENDLPIPKITVKYISHIFQIVTKQAKYEKKRKKDASFTDVQKFYNDHYSKTVFGFEVIYRDKLQFILAYEAIDMLTNLETNIKTHFFARLKKYLRNFSNYYSHIARIKEKPVNQRRKSYKRLNDKITSLSFDICNFKDLEFESKPKYHNFIRHIRSLLFPGKAKFKQDYAPFELEVEPQNFLYATIRICWDLEGKITPENPIDLFNVLPLRRNIIPKYICIDTQALIFTLVNENIGYNRANYKKKAGLQLELWNKIFKMNRTFKKGKKYGFNFMISTDGISASILFKRLDKKGKFLTKKFCDSKEEEEVEYIDDIYIEDEIKTSKIVGIDLNKGDLAYCGSKNRRGYIETFRYTNEQRKQETRSKKYAKIKTKLLQTKVNGKTIKELEDVLSNFNSKTCSFESFKKYCIEKNKLNGQVFDFYKQYFFRKSHLNVYINTQKSEAKMIKNFSNKFGKPENVTIIMGDWSEKSQMRGKEPTISKKFRKIFKKAGYELYLIDEFRTSKLCNFCNGVNEKFLKKTKDGKVYICNGLLRCSDCEYVHNRDTNAVQNILKITKHLIEHDVRPPVFVNPCRN